MSQRVLIGKSEEFAMGKLTTIDLKGVSVVVARTAAGVCAVQNRCSHLGLPLSGGKLDGETLTCPWHNSKFEMCTGKNLDWVAGVVGVKIPDWSRRLVSLGMQPRPIKAYTVVEDGGQVYIELP
jgi:nitrite reductase/ring-hydroxylating ferredoxin subunit